MDNQIQLSPYQRERMEKAQELAKQIGWLVNSFSYRESLEEFNQAMTREHPTHQQAFAALILNYINFVASDEYKADGRNEYSKEVFTKIAAFMKEQGITSHMPMI
jgi:hypothetical protein